MKKKEITKKLSLKKQTIADLRIKEMNDIHGGTGEDGTIPNSICTCGNKQTVCSPEPSQLVACD